MFTSSYQLFSFFFCTFPRATYIFDIPKKLRHGVICSCASQLLNGKVVRKFQQQQPGKSDIPPTPRPHQYPLSVPNSSYRLIFVKIRTKDGHFLGKVQKMLGRGLGCYKPLVTKIPPYMVHKLYSERELSIKLLLGEKKTTYI